MHLERDTIIEDFLSFLKHKAFPCIGAKASMATAQLKCTVAGHMACPNDDRGILQFLYDFIIAYRGSDGLFHSAAIIFRQPAVDSEEMFDALLWQRLQALSDLDAETYGYDERVNPVPTSSFFSFSLKEEAMFVIGLHPSSSRLARRFKHPALVFNPHAQFEKLKETNRYEKMKSTIRKRDILYSGSVNPMLEDFGKSSEVYQYSGRKYDSHWQCPLKSNHEPDKDNPAT